MDKLLSVLSTFFEDIEEIKLHKKSIIQNCDDYIYYSNRIINDFKNKLEFFKNDIINIEKYLIYCKKEINNQVNSIKTHNNWKNIESENHNKYKNLKNDVNQNIKPLIKEIQRQNIAISENVKFINQNITETINRLNTEFTTLLKINNIKNDSLNELKKLLDKNEELQDEFVKKILIEPDISEWNVYFEEINNREYINKISLIIKQIQSKIKSFSRDCDSFIEIIKNISDYDKLMSSCHRFSNDIDDLKLNEAVFKLNKTFLKLQQIINKSISCYNQKKNEYLPESLDPSEIKSKIEYYSKQYINFLPIRFEEFYDELNQLHIDESRYFEKVNRSINSILKIINLPNYQLIFNIIKHQYHDIKIYTHLINVCIYSLLIGVRADLTEEQLLDLGLCAVFHDIGFIEIKKINPNLSNSQEFLSDIEKYSPHPIISVQIIKKKMDKSKRFTTEMLDSIIMHHLNIDGTGYPEHAISMFNNKYHEIPLYARILRIADEYDIWTMKKEKNKLRAKIEMQRNIDKFDKIFFQYFMDMLIFIA